MKRGQKILLIGSAVLLSGALIGFYRLPRIGSLHRALLLGYGYVLPIALMLGLVTRLIGEKLSAFSRVQQWVLRTFLYTLAISIGYLVGLAFETLLVFTPETLGGNLAANLWKVFPGVLSLIYPGWAAESPLVSARIVRLFAGFLATFFLISLVSMVGSYIEIRWRELQRRQQVERAELTALRAQIEPHFLFNTLNTVASLIRPEPERAERLLLQLSDILRYRFRHSGQETIALGEEIAFTRNYLALLQARFPDRLDVHWEVSLRDEDRPVPLFLFQPLVENAVQHGWNDRRQPLKLTIRILERSDEIEVTVADNGRGIPPDILNQLPRPGHALDNIARRLVVQYRRSDLLEIRSRTGEGTEVRIKIPLGET